MLDESIQEQIPDGVFGIYGACRSCRLGKSCLLKSIPESEIVQFEEIIERKFLLKSGAHLFRQGEHFSSIYVVQSGLLKSYCSPDNEGEQITGLYFPGDLVGLGAICQDSYEYSLQAIETTTVCELPYDSLLKLSGQLPGLQQNLFKLISYELNKIQKVRSCLRHKSADSRYAAFLLSNLERTAKTDDLTRQVDLKMPRSDIANYLNLAQETVCRVSGRFQKEGLIEVDESHIIFKNIKQLRKIANIPAFRQLKQVNS